ncbi:MAG: FAD-dependent oxidoreductase [Acidobacteria bacterium]|nr:FAD-dependent oxidoreductase [Acidobacteriota bacterium]
MSDLNDAQAMPWPYPVSYGKENEVRADVLVLGGGIAGCHAAVHAARRGAKVVVVDKGPVIRSGSGGAGVDHWHAACTNPCSKVTPDEMMEAVRVFGDYSYGEFGNGITSYIQCNESYDALMDVEKMGVKVRDVDDQFVGAEFRDGKTKLLFAYDYVNKTCIRVNGGAHIKVALYNELRRLGVQICDRIMVTSLLTEGGKQGARLVGATGVNVRTGEFYIFNAKTAILSMSVFAGQWVFSTELAGFGSIFNDPNNSGDGTAMAWNAGAELALMERSGRVLSSGFFRYPPYGTGDHNNTWFACTIVDANGKEIPYVDRDGNMLKTVSERYRPAPGQKFSLYGRMGDYSIWAPTLIPDLSERIAKGEYALPLYADLPGMPEHERRAIWGLMIYNEGKCSIIYENYCKAGFDPDKDMLQLPVMPPEQYGHGPAWETYGPRQWREGAFGGGGGIVFDWDLKSNIEGLYVAGSQQYSGGTHSHAAATGRYAGRKAASCARNANPGLIDRKQVAEEKARVYAPVMRNDGIGWKELRAGLCRIMQDYCGEFKSEQILQMGLRWIRSIRESEASTAFARNPHELCRILECQTHMTIGEIIMQASLARKASSLLLDFKRLDYPEPDPPEWNKIVTIRQENNSVKVGELPMRYWLLPPYAPSCEENYRKHCEL